MAKLKYEISLPRTPWKVLVLLVTFFFLDSSLPPLSYIKNLLPQPDALG